MARKAEKDKQRLPNPLIAVVLGWLIPGAGHVYIGRTARGAIIFVTIAAMFWGGIAIGGVMTVDKVYERWWFVADMLTGVHGVAAWYRTRGVYQDMDEKLARSEDFRRQQEDRLQPYGGRVPAAVMLGLKREYYDQILAKDNKALVPPQGTVAQAYAGVAGLMNLLCVFDAMILAVMGAGGESTPPRKKDGEGQAQVDRPGDTETA